MLQKESITKAARQLGGDDVIKNALFVSVIWLSVCRDITFNSFFFPQFNNNFSVFPQFFISENSHVGIENEATADVDMDIF